MKKNHKNDLSDNSNLGEIILKTTLGILRKYIKYSVGGSHLRRNFTSKTKDLVLFWQHFRCNSCRSHLDVVDFHHIDGNNWNNDRTNCEALCPNCHARKSRR